MNNKFFLNSILLTLFLLGICGQELIAQMPKLDQKYKKLEVKANPKIKKEILRLREIGAKKKWTFQVGNTGVAKYLNQNDIKLITGAKLPIMNKNNRTPKAKNSGSSLNTGINPRSTRFDVRNRGFITSVKSQGGCGSCWAFCATATIETAQIIRNNNVNRSNIDLSEQYVLSCSGGGGCGGGGLTPVYEYLKRLGKGMPTEASFQYRASDLACPASPRYTDYEVEDWGWVGRNAERPTVAEVKNALARYGAVGTYIWVNSSFGHYTNGVINDDDRTGWGGWHCVQIVGWDDVLGAYLIKNSWGTNWGMNGFAWVDYNVLDVAYFSSWVLAKRQETIDLNSYYSCNDGGRYYVRQMGSNVYWFGEHPSGNWANVFKGKLNGSYLTGTFYDVPKGKMKGQGELELKVKNGGRTIEKLSGLFGGTVFTKKSLPRELPKAREAGYTANNSLDGLWNCDDGGQYYVREVGGKVVWFGEGGLNAKGKPHFANVAFGAKRGNILILDWADVPKCNLTGQGRIRLRIDNYNKLTRVDRAARFGGKNWRKAPNINGNWVNKDANTQGVTKFTVSQESTKIHAYGSCKPRDCDWGVDNLTKDGANYKAIHRKGTMKKTITLVPLPNGEMKMLLFSEYSDGRRNNTATYYFRKR